MNADQRAALKKARQEAGDKAHSAGFDRGFFDRCGTESECEAYSQKGIWPKRAPAQEAKRVSASVREIGFNIGAAVESMSGHFRNRLQNEPVPKIVVDSDQSTEVAPMFETADMPAVQFSTFSDKNRPRAYLRSLSRDGFIAFLTKRDVRPEKDGKAFAPATFKATRSNADFISATGLCLDFDHERPRVEDVLALLPGTLAAFYSTHSHLPENPRFRVVVPLSRPVNADEHARLIQGVKSIIPHELMECLDGTCFERTRSHYLPSCPPEREHHAFTGHQDGGPLDADYFIRLGETVAAVEPTTRSKTGSAPAQLPAATSFTFEFADPATGEVHDLAAWAARNPTFDLVRALDPQHRRGALKEGKQHIQCPFDDQHTDQSPDTATFVANASPPQFPAWDVHCCHAHCVNRDRLKFLQAFLEKGWMSADHLQTNTAPAGIEMRRPPKIYYPVNDINAAPEWSTLLPEERRIALHVMVICWAEDDGPIADDDWMIARQLGIPERDWTDGYRPTLKRAGWLIEVNGRLSSPLVKREFNNAQVAYMRVIERAAAGGKSTQEKRAHKKQL